MRSSPAAPQSSPTAIIGDLVGSIGSVDVTGTGSFWNTDPLTVGLSGSGQLTVANHALVSATGGLIVAENCDSIGNVYRPNLGHPP